MKRLFFTLAVVVLLAVPTGCNRQYVNSGGGCGVGGVGCGMAAGYGGEGMCVTGNCGNGGACGCDAYGPMDRCKSGGGLAGLCSGLGCHRGPEYAAPGPPTAQVAYPYYTVRGPRDFLCSNPPTIGPR